MTININKTGVLIFGKDCDWMAKMSRFAKDFLFVHQKGWNSAYFLFCFFSINENNSLLNQLQQSIENKEN